MRLTLLTLIAVLFLGASCQKTPSPTPPMPAPLPPAPATQLLQPAQPSAPQAQPPTTPPQPSARESSAAPAAMADDNLDQALQDLDAVE